MKPAFENPGVGQVATFALIIGVSEYPFLAGGREDQGLPTYGFGQLASSALTAFRFFQWIKDVYRFDAAPLGKCWFLASPTAAEVAIEPTLAHFPRATMTNCVEAIEDWYGALAARTAASTRACRSVFFFSGHGLQREASQFMLLPSDYLRGPRNVNDAIDARNLLAGLDELPRGEDLFFVDACRVNPSEMSGLELRPRQILTTSFAKDDNPDRVAPMLYAAASGAYAWQPKDPAAGISCFGQALLESLMDDVDAARSRCCHSGSHIGLIQLFFSVMSRVTELLKQGGTPLKRPVELVPLVDDLCITAVVAPANLTAGSSARRGGTRNGGSTRGGGTRNGGSTRGGGPETGSSAPRSGNGVEKRPDDLLGRDDGFGLFSVRGYELAPEPGDRSLAPAASGPRPRPAAQPTREQDRKKAARALQERLADMAAAPPAAEIETKVFANLAIRPRRESEGELYRVFNSERVTAAWHSAHAYLLRGKRRTASEIVIEHVHRERLAGSTTEQYFQIDLSFRDRGAHWIQLEIPYREKLPFFGLSFPPMVESGDQKFVVEMTRGGDSEYEVDVSLSPRSSRLLSLAAELWNKYRDHDLAKVLATVDQLMLENVLREKKCSAVAALVAATVLVRAGQAADRAQWLRNLANLFPELPDSRVLCAEVARQQKTRDRAWHDDLLEIADGPLPYTRYGLLLAAEQVREILAYIEAHPKRLESSAVARIERLHARLQVAVPHLHGRGLFAVFAGKDISPALVLP